MDEFYHASAPTYQRFQNYFKSKILLGLTAAPERMDGASILDYFDNRIANVKHFFTINNLQGTQLSVQIMKMLISLGIDEEQLLELIKRKL